MAHVPDCDERALREVAQVYERIKIQQPLLLLHYSSQLAQNLLSEALRALNIALSVMNQQPAASPVSVTKKQIIKAAEAKLSSPSPAAAEDSSATTTSTARRGKRRRSSVIEGKNSSSWVNLTAMPYEDGYEWRKYGEKKINGTTYTRSYFRCTYKDDTGCMATKHIQQKDNNDPPMFQVTYNNDHTCNRYTTTDAKRNDSSNKLPFLGYFNSEEGAINPPNNDGHTASMVKQEEPQQLLPPLAGSCAALPLDQTTFQGPHHANQPVYVTATFSAHHHHAGTPSTSSSTDSSCITGLSCNGCPGDMAAVEPAAENDLIRDLEHFLMYDIDNS